MCSTRDNYIRGAMYAYVELCVFFPKIITDEIGKSTNHVRMQDVLWQLSFQIPI